MKKTLVAAILSLALTACGGGSDTAAQTPSAKPEAEQSGKLNIYNWSDYVDPETVAAFEKETGIKMRSDYYDSNETLEGKVLTGKSGYDLTAPSIANVGRQIKAGAYQKIDKAQIPHYGNIDKDLLKMMEAVDPGNEYAVPYFWGINTLAINTRQVQKALGTDKLPENEWDLVFKPEYTANSNPAASAISTAQSNRFPWRCTIWAKTPTVKIPKTSKPPSI